MTEDGKFVSIEDFRQNAQEKDYQELWNFYQSGTRNFPTGKDPKPECRFRFSATAAKKALDEWQAKKKEDTTATAPTKEEPGEGIPLVFPKEKKDFDKRSVMMTQEHWTRLQALYDKYPVINKNYVLQALLEEALTRAGV